MIEVIDSGKFFRFVYCFAFAVFINTETAQAQTPVFIETFGDTPPGVCDQGTLANGFLTIMGPWTVSTIGVNDSAANEWYISATEPGPPAGACAIPGCDVNSAQRNRTLHVGNVANSPNAGFYCLAGDCGAVYDPGGFQLAVQTDKRAESPSFFVQAGINYFLIFNYLEYGDNAVNIDNATIEFFDGTSWIAVVGGDAPRTLNTCGSTYEWEKFAVPLPPTATNTSARVGFRWKNDNGGVGSNPSFAVDSIIVIPASPPVANITVSDTDLCVNDCIDFFADSAGFGATYSWTFTGASISSSSNQNPSGICYFSPGTLTAILEVTSLGGTDYDTVQIIVNPCLPPAAEFFASDTIFCERDCITFTDASLNGPTGWSWFFPGGTPATSSSPSPPPICYSSPGFYDVTLIAFNQFGADTITKVAYLQADSCPLPIADFTSTPYQFCPQHCVSFTDNSQYGPITSYRWIFPGGVPDTSSAANPSVCYSYEGFYDVQLIVSNQYGSDTIIKYSEVHVEMVPNAFASPDTSMFFGESYHLNAGGGVAYQWSPLTGLSDTSGGSNPAVIPNPLATPTATTTYTVAITDATGCTAYRQVTITILHNNDVFIPTAFSPNGDGANDVLFVRGNNIYGMRISIFDRWGEKIFETTSMQMGWDGTYKGKELDPGVFTYVITVNYENKDSITQTGTVTLVR